MLVKTLKTYFNEELLGYYPETEIHSFFYILSEHILKMKRIDIAVNGYKVVLSKKFNKFQTAIERLKSYEPIQYILGQTEFYGLQFKVNNTVLIPRPETEELVDWIIKEQNNNKPITILDIGTGSGCIAITLAKHLQHAKVYALDVSLKALTVAKDNAKLNKVEIHCIHNDILNFKTEQDMSQFDVIVSNPPYVRHLEKQEINNNVLQHEPHLALFVDDDDALVFYREISEFSKKHLKKNGLLYFEINEYLGKDMKRLMHDSNFKDINLKQDIFNKDRMIKGVKI